MSTSIDPSSSSNLAQSSNLSNASPSLHAQQMTSVSMAEAILVSPKNASAPNPTPTSKHKTLSNLNNNNNNNANIPNANKPNSPPHTHKTHSNHPPSGHTRSNSNSKSNPTNNNSGATASTSNNNSTKLSSTSIDHTVNATNTDLTASTLSLASVSSAGNSAVNSQSDSNSTGDGVGRLTNQLSRTSIHNSENHDELDPNDEDDFSVDSDDDKEDKQLCLFVGDVSRYVTEDNLRDAFSRFGEILNVEIKRDKVTNYNLGYGFVQFSTLEAVSRAKEEMEGYELGGRKIRLGWARRNTTLFVGSLDGNVTTEQLREAFSRFGPIEVDETFVKSGSGKFGFVRFRNRSDAERAKSEMHHKILGTRPIRIGWGGNNIQKHCVHIQLDSLHSSASEMTDDAVRVIFQQFGTVASVSLPRYPNGKIKGFGFVHFEENEEGERAAARAISKLSEANAAENLRLRCSYGRRKTKQGTSRPPTKARRYSGHVQENPSYNYLIPSNWPQGPVEPVSQYPNPNTIPPYYVQPQGSNQQPVYMYYPMYYPSPDMAAQPQHQQVRPYPQNAVPIPFPTSPTRQTHFVTSPNNSYQAIPTMPNVRGGYTTQHDGRMMDRPSLGDN